MNRFSTRSEHRKTRYTNPNTMMVEAKSIFADIARLKWPNAERISGSGQFAVVLRCTRTVELFDDRKAAFNNYSQPCGPACQRKHERVELQRPRPIAKRKPHWIKYLND